MSGACTSIGRTNPAISIFRGRLAPSGKHSAEEPPRRARLRRKEFLTGHLRCPRSTHVPTTAGGTCRSFGILRPLMTRRTELDAPLADGPENRRVPCLIRQECYIFSFPLLTCNWSNSRYNVKKKEETIDVRYCEEEKRSYRGGLAI